MTLVSSMDFVKCRMSRTLFFLLNSRPLAKFLDPDTDGLLKAFIPGLAFRDWTSMI